MPQAPPRPGKEQKHREWIARLPRCPDGATLKAVWSYEETNRRARMKAREDKRAAEEAAERARAQREMERRMAKQRRDVSDKRRRQREHREAKRFARHMEEERIRQRMIAGDRWVADRMHKITEIEDLDEEMKQMKAKERLMRTYRCWSELDMQRDMMANDNRINQMQRLRPLSTLGVDLQKLCMGERISPMLHRNEALTNARQMVAQQDRQKMDIDLRVSKEQQRLLDLAITRRTAEDRAESQWRIANQIPLSATMDSLRPGMLPIPIADASQNDAPQNGECAATEQWTLNEGGRVNDSSPEAVRPVVLSSRNSETPSEGGGGYTSEGEAEGDPTEEEPEPTSPSSPTVEQLQPPRQTALDLDGEDWPTENPEGSKTGSLSGSPILEPQPESGLDLDEMHGEGGQTI